MLAIIYFTSYKNETTVVPGKIETSGGKRVVDGSSGSLFKFSVILCSFFDFWRTIVS